MTDSVAGRLVSSSGAPVAAASVRLSGLQTSSGSDGTFSFAFVPLGRHSMSVVATGYVRFETYFTVGQEPVEIVLYQPASLVGRLFIAATGAPVGGASLHLLGDSGSEARSSVTGHFVLGSVLPGKVTLVVDVGASTRFAHFDLDEGEKKLVDVALPSSVVVLRLLDSHGDVLTNARINGGQRPVLTDESGSAAVELLVAPFEMVDLEVTLPQDASDLSCRIRAGTREAGALERVDVIIPPICDVVIVGREHNGVALPASVALRASSIQHCRVMPRAAGDPAHRVVVRCYKGADARIQLRAPGYACAEVRIDAGSNDAVEVRLKRLGTLRGHVGPIRELRGGPLWVWINAEGLRRMPIGADGSFKVGGVRPGRVRLYLGQGGVPRASREVALGEGDSVDLGQIELVRPRVLRGRVHDESQRGLGGVIVEVLGEDGHNAETSTRHDGSFAVQLPAGSGVVLFRKRRFGLAIRSFVRLRSDNSPNVLLASPGHAIIHAEVTGAAAKAPSIGYRIGYPAGSTTVWGPQMVTAQCIEGRAIVALWDMGFDRVVVEINAGCVDSINEVLSIVCVPGTTIHRSIRLR